MDKPSVEKATIQDYIEQEFASSKYVDHFDVWANNLALSEEEIGRWITMLNRAQKMNPDDDVKPQPPYIEEEIPFDMTCKIFLLVHNFHCSVLCSKFSTFEF